MLFRHAQMLVLGLIFVAFFGSKTTLARTAEIQFHLERVEENATFFRTKSPLGLSQAVMRKGVPLLSIVS